MKTPTRPTPPGRLCTGQRIPEGMTREEWAKNTETQNNMKSPSPGALRAEPTAEHFNRAQSVDYNVFAETMNGRGGCWAEHRMSFNYGFAYALAETAADKAEILDALEKIVSQINLGYKQHAPSSVSSHFRSAELEALDILAKHGRGGR